ncbi:MAG TPA: hypothetical protein V6C57_13305 [Coleofasciculaceae cyanobacterium]
MNISFYRIWLGSGVLLAVNIAVSQAIASNIFGQPDFFDEGQEQLEREINRLQQQQPNLTLPVEPSPQQQWQPLVSRAGGFAVWMPPGTMTEETKILETSIGTLKFDVLASNLDAERYVAAYAPYEGEDQDADTILTALNDAIASRTKFNVKSNRAISLGNYSGRELILASSDQQITLRTYLVQRQLYVLGASGSDSHDNAKIATFFNSFQLLK